MEQTCAACGLGGNQKQDQHTSSNHLYKSIHKLLSSLYISANALANVQGPARHRVMCRCGTRNVTMKSNPASHTLSISMRCQNGMAYKD
jgi:hypothetical protein